MTRRIAKAVLTWETVRLLAFVVAPVWGAGVYVAESTTGVLEEQLEVCREREQEYLSLVKDLLGLDSPDEGENDE